MNLNRVFLAGRLTRDPQLRYTPSGTAVADLGLAVNRSFTDASGQRRDETCFVDVVLWRKQAELTAKHLQKGSPIFIEGRLTFESWEGKDGQRRSRLKVVGENFQFMGESRDRQQGYQGVPSAPPQDPRDSEPQPTAAAPGPPEPPSTGYDSPVQPAPFQPDPVATPPTERYGAEPTPPGEQPVERRMEPDNEIPF